MLFYGWNEFADKIKWFGLLWLCYLYRVGMLDVGMIAHSVHVVTMLLADDIM
jgi:hypothetical protein